MWVQEVVSESWWETETKETKTTQIHTHTYTYTHTRTHTHVHTHAFVCVCGGGGHDRCQLMQTSAGRSCTSFAETNFTSSFCLLLLCFSESRPLWARLTHSTSSFSSSSIHRHHQPFTRHLFPPHFSVSLRNEKKEMQGHRERPWDSSVGTEQGVHTRSAVERGRGRGRGQW